MPRMTPPKEMKPLTPSPELIETCKTWIESHHSTLWGLWNVQEGRTKRGLQEAAEWLATQICGVAFTDTTPIQSMTFATDVRKAVSGDAPHNR